MNKQELTRPEGRVSRVAHWISMIGLLTIVSSIFAFLFLFVADLVGDNPNPYVGILTYLVAPMFSTLGVALMILGFLLRRRAYRRQGGEVPVLIDVRRLQKRGMLGWFVGGTAAFLLISAVGSYHSYHFTESVSFCGQACHTVMEPEFVTYQNSHHARVACAECHIGPGAEWYVKAKLSGLYQVYATLLDKYPRPVPTPIKNLRPARDTCEQCHWPERFSGNLVRTYNHYLTDDANTEYSLRLMLKVGGGDPGQGRVSGIHWHIANQVEYLPSDESKLEIPWVRYTDSAGQVVEYRAEGFEGPVDPDEVRRMDCMDCHNRPSHAYQKPNDSVDQALVAGRIDIGLPGIRGTAAGLLVAEYGSVEEAMTGIDRGLRAAYPESSGLESSIETLQGIYRRNFFPVMNASWKDYPEHIGHKDWPGCVRCHDDKHRSTDGQRVIEFQNCNTCHLILAQGSAADLDQPSMSGQEFKHPGDDVDPEFKCHDCHNGGP